MASLLVVVIIAGCAAYQYLKGTLVKSFAAVITAVCAGTVAFGYFEASANVIINRGNESLTPWAQSLCFILLFVLTFAVLQIIAAQLTRHKVELPLLAERIGRSVCGVLLGLIIAGTLLTALAMAPLQNNWPYQRFDASRPDAEKPNTTLFNADGFTAGWFSIISSGSFSGKTSFAAVHPDFINQMFLNRHNTTDKIPTVTGSEAIETPKKAGVWPSPEDLKDSKGKPVPSKSNYNLTIVRVGLKKKTIKEAGVFTLSQLRLVCKEKSDAQNPLSGKGKNIYPIGYLKTANQLQIKQLNDQIEIESADFKGRTRWIDFAFYVPNGFQPTLVEFKQNNIVQVAPPVAAAQAPPTVALVPLAECAKGSVEVQPLSSAKVYGVELAEGRDALEDLSLEIKDPNQWQSTQTARSIAPARFEGDKISYVRAELKVEKPAEDEPKQKRSWNEDKKGIMEMLKTLEGYTLLSLKCNNPSGGTAIRGQQLPFLVELSGLIHRPVGIIASAKAGGQTIYEVDYCSLTADDMEGGLVIAEDGAVAQPFPDNIWLTQQAQNISEFYVLYLVKSGRKAIIISVQPGDARSSAGFEKYEGFFVK